MTTQYAAIINVPGYLPMDDEPATFDTPAEAWAYLAEERERAEENAVCDETCEDGPACQWGQAQDYTDTLAELKAGEGVGTIYGDTPGSHSDHDLGLAYCVVEAE